MKAVPFKFIPSEQISNRVWPDLWVGIGMILIAIFAQYSGLDIEISRFISHAVGGQFLTSNGLLSMVFQQDGRYLVSLFFSILNWSCALLFTFITS